MTNHSNFNIRDDKHVSNIYSAYTKEETETSLLLKNLVSEKSKFKIIDNFDRCIVNLSVVIIILIIHINSFIILCKSVSSTL